MGAHRPRPRLEGRLRPLTTTDKPPADRLYGRIRGHALRPRQQALLDGTLPRLLIGPDEPAAFTHPALALEIGFGGGEHALALALADPARHLIACEVFEPGLCSLLSRLVPDGADPATAPLPPNLAIFDDDARILLRAMPPACLDLLVLNFPDPWPKARHAKRRFVHPAQLPLAARVLKPGAEWRIATDDPTYQAWTREVLAASPLFHQAEPTAGRPPGWPATRYEAKAIRAGRRPLYWSLTRTGVPAAV